MHGIFSCSMWDLVPWPGIEPRHPALGAWSCSHWTTKEVPSFTVKESKMPRDPMLKSWSVIELRFVELESLSTNERIIINTSVNEALCISDCLLNEQKQCVFMKIEATFFLLSCGHLTNLWKFILCVLWFYISFCPFQPLYFWNKDNSLLEWSLDLEALF